jgi:hypothetical protein
MNSGGQPFNRKLLINEINEAHSALWLKVHFFQAVGNPFDPASATVDHGVITVITRTGNRTVESLDPDLLPKLKVLSTVPSDKFGLTPEQMVKVSRFDSSYSTFKVRLSKIASEGSNLPYKVTLAAAQANGAIERAAYVYCALGISPPKVFKPPHFDDFPLPCDSLQNLEDHGLNP